MAIKKLRDFTVAEKQEFNRLVMELAKIPIAASFAAECRIWFNKGEISPEEEVRFTRWCKDSKEPSRIRAREIAKDISKIIFEKVKTKHD